MSVTAEAVAAELQALRNELLESRRREDELNNRVQALQTGGHGLQEAMAALAAVQRETLERARAREEKVTLVDNKGLAKPDKFGRHGSEGSFLQWKVRLETFILSVHKDLEQPLAYAEDCDEQLTATKLKALFGPTTPAVEHIPGLEEKDAQLHAVLQTLCEGEAFTLVRSAGRGAGLEAWRKLHRRYDPSTGGRRRALLRSVLAPQKCQRIEDLSSAIELWEEAVRQFEARRRPDGTRAQLDEDIKVAVLEAMCPSDLEKHLQLSRHRLTTYEEVRGELASYLETRLGAKVQLSLPGASKDDQGPAPMDVGAFDKGKGKKGKDKGKGKGGKAAGGKQKETRECHNCGKVGHLAANCWAPKKEKKGKGEPHKKKEGKGKDKKGKGKGGKNLHNVEEAEPEEESEEPEANFLAIAGLTEVSLSESEDEGLHDTSRPYRPAGVKGATVKQEPGESSHEPKAAESLEQGPGEGASGASSSAGPGPAREPKEEMKEEEEEMKEEEEESSESSSSYVEVLLYPGDPGYDSLGEGGATDSDEEYMEVCVEPCGYCYFEECDQRHDDEFRHVCPTCRLAKMSADHKSKVLLWTPLEAFEFSVDKTICVVKGLSLEQFRELTEEQKGAYRDAVDPEQVKRINQDDVLKGLSRFREAERKSFFKKAGHPQEDPSQASGQAGVQGEQASGSKDLPARPSGAASGTLMHRTIEMLEITNLAAEKREKAQLLEMEEDPEEVQRLETRIREIDAEVKVLKERTKAADREASKKPQLTAETVLDQTWHDARYHKAVAAGVSHSQAWHEEKKRRKAALHRQQGTADRAKERLENERAWHREFDSRPVKEEEYHDEAAPGLETEAVEETDQGRLRVLTGSARQVKRGELRKGEEATFVASARTYRKLSQAEVSRFKTETKEDERKVMERKRVDLQKKRVREMTEEKKDARKKRVKAASRRKEACRDLLWFGECTRARCPFGHDPELVKKAKFSVCSEFSRGVCQRKQCRFVHDELEREKYQLLRRHRQRRQGASGTSGSTGIVLREAPKRERTKEEPLDLAHLSGACEEESWDGYKKVTVNFDTGAAISAIPVEVARAATKKTAASERCYRTASGEVIEDQGGALVQGYDAAGVGRKIEGRVTDVHRMLASGAAVGKHNHVLLMGSKGYVMPKGGKIAKALEKTFRETAEAGHGKDVLEMEERRGIYVFDLWVKESKEKDCATVGALGEGASEEANSRQAAGASQAIGQAVPGAAGGEGEGVGASRSDGPADPEGEGSGEQRRARVPRAPTAPTRAEVEEHEATGHVIHRSWCPHCVRARGDLERHPRVKEEDRSIPTISFDYFFFSEEGQPHLQVKDDFTKMMWSSAIPAKGADPFAANFVAACVGETGYRKIILKSDNEASLKALKELAKQSIQGVEVLPEESKTGDSRANGRVEASVKETKREDGRTAYERLKGKAWRLPCVCFGERVWFRPLAAYAKKHLSKGTDPKVLAGHYVGTHARNGDALVMTTQGVLRGGSLRRMSPEERWNDDEFDKLQGVPWKPMASEESRRTEAPVKVDLPEMVGPTEVATRASGARNLYVMRSDVENDPTPGCPGCEAIMLDLPAVTHNQFCRGRIQEKLSKTPEGKARVERAMKRKSAAMDGRPDAQESETQAATALGAPEDAAGSEKRKQEGAAEEAADKKGRVEAKGTKRQGVDPEDLYWEDQLEEPQVVEVQPSSGSAAEGSSLSHSAFWSPVVPGAPAGGPSQAGGQAESGGEQAQQGDDAMPDAGLLELAQLVVDDPGDSDLCEVAGLLKSLGKRGPEEATGRLAEVHNKLGLEVGFSLDLEAPKEGGERWDLSKGQEAECLKAKLCTEKPLLLVGSLPVGPFSPAATLCKKSAKPQKQLAEEGRAQLRNQVECFKEQHASGRYFLYEHPRGCGGWEEPSFRDLRLHEGVQVVEGPVCKWRLGASYVKRVTRWVTNSAILAARLKAQCVQPMQRNLQIVEGTACEPGKYPAPLAKAILTGLKGVLLETGELSAVTAHTAGPVPDEPELEVDWSQYVPTGDRVYWDTITGAQLDADHVERARAEELQWVRKQEVYRKVRLEQCYEDTGRAPITLKWLDRNKGDASNPNYRSRLVVREVKKSSRTDDLPEHELFSAMPPLEALKLLCSILVSQKVSAQGKPLKLKLFDISRAHFYGQSRRKVYTNLPEGDEQEGYCALLQRTMYGTQDASSVWQETYTKLMDGHGIKNGSAWPAIFGCSERGLRMLVHGDDFFVLGDDDGQKFVEGVLAEKFEYRIDGCIGPEATDGTTLTVLNRIIEYDKATGTVKYEADPRHAEMVVKSLGLETAKPVTTPAEKQTLQSVLASMTMPPLPPDQASLYRSVVMRASYLSQDRADIAEAVKTLARRMQSPTEYDMSRLKRLGRYLKGRPRVQILFRPQQMFTKLRCYVDSDHAGCLVTRRSTSGLILMAGRHCIKSSSTLQSTISLSSGESEYYAIVKGAALTLSMVALLEQWDLKVEAVVSSDSSAARGTCSRRGLGKLRHVQTRYLWVQERVQRKDISIEAVGTAHNVADACTKPLTAEVIAKHMASIGQVFSEGKSVAAKAVS
ncbi:unnamed protein product [Symbiodinium sp. CCMP2592]|nr:unnamed protein product [Symbiodinium sp. CCMP2592]